MNDGYVVGWLGFLPLTINLKSSAKYIYKMAAENTCHFLGFATAVCSIYFVGRPLASFCFWSPMNPFRFHLVSFSSNPSK